MRQNTYKLLFVALFLLNSSVATSKTRQLILKESDSLTISMAEPVLLNGQIIFLAEDNNELSIWSLNPESGERNKVYTGPLWRSFDNKYLHVLNDRLVFVSGEFDFRTLWQSNGTAAGTSLISQSWVNSAQRQVGELLFAQGNGGSALIATDGIKIIEHPIQAVDVQNICAFGVDDVISKQFDLNSNTYTLLRSNSDGVSEIALPVATSGYLAINQNNMWTLGEQCFIGISGDDGLSEVIVVSRNGGVSYLSEDIELSEIYTIFNFDQRVYLHKTNFHDSSEVQRLNMELSEVDATIKPTSGNVFIDFKTSNNHLIGRTRSTGSPHFYETYFFDKNLNRNDQLGGIHFPYLDIYQTLDGETFVFDMSTSRSNKILLNDDNVPSVTDGVTFANVKLNYVIASPSSSVVYTLSTDKTSGQRAIHTITDKPGIGQSINGHWHDAEIKNQGVSIHTGERLDGSEYVFVTVYTYRDGAPFWLAGVANIVLPQPKIEMLVGEYSNGNMFDPESTPTENVFGSLTLEMTACNRLKTTITSDEVSFVLNLSRIHNIQHSHLCSDSY